MISNVVILLFTAEDLAAMPNCIRWLRTQEPERVLVLVTPNVGITGPELTREHDAKIAGLEKEKEQAKLVENFDLAKVKKEEIEAAIMERDMALRDGWQKIPEAERAAIHKKVLSGFGTEPVMLREAYSHEEAFQMLNSYRIQWPRDIPFDEYVIIFPRAIRKVEAVTYEPKGETVSTAGMKRPPTWDSHQPHAPLKQTIITPAQAQAEGIVAGVEKTITAPRVSAVDVGFDKKGAATFTDARMAREHKLRLSRFMGCKAAATKLGVYQEGMNMEQMISAILEKEFPPIPA